VNRWKRQGLFRGREQKRLNAVAKRPIRTASGNKTQKFKERPAFTKKTPNAIEKHG